MEEDRFHEVLVRGCSVKKPAHVSMYVKDVIEVPRKQVGFFGKQNVIIRPKQRSAGSTFFSSMATEYIPKL